MNARGFSLVELLAVVAIIGAASAFLLGRTDSNGRSLALQSAQAELANAISLARVRAIASGESCRVLIHVDASSMLEPKRFLRRVVLQELHSATWQTMFEFSLPSGVYVLPGNFSSLPTGLFVPGEESAWVRSDNSSALRSTALRSSMITTESIDSSSAEQWVSIVLSALGSTAQSGDIVLTTGEVRAPGTFASGESPIELRNPDHVLGLTLSAYGATALVHDRLSF